MTDADVLCFYSQSADKPPGANKQSGERGDPSSYPALRSIPHWRRVLSNFHMENLAVNGVTYASAEHAFHAAKFHRCGAHNVARVFSVESGSKLSRADAKSAKKAGGKSGGLLAMSPEQRSMWEQHRAEEVLKIHRAKFGPAGLPRRVLLATGEAQLWHILSRRGKERWDELEALRTELRREEQAAEVQMTGLISHVVSHVTC